MSRLAEQRPRELAERIRAEGGRRAYLAGDAEGRLSRLSHPFLRELAEDLAADVDFRAHEALFLEASRETGALLGAVLHRTVRGQAQGGLRHWPYEDVRAFARDGLRLSLAMTRKNALAGLWWGGGKGLIARLPDGAHRDPGLRRDLYREYGDFVSSLHGCYVTAEDAGTTPSDLVEVFRRTRFVTCIPPELGGSGNPSAMTAAGVVCAMEAALDWRGLGSLAGRRVVLQGTGHVGTAMLPLLLERGAERVIASEISAERRDALCETYADAPVEIRLVKPDDASILAEPCDVLAPCALGGVLGPETIPSLRARVICGAANNQLVDPDRDGRELAERGITYVPELIANRMGIVSCANEQYGSLPDDPDVRRHLDPAWPGGVHATTRAALDRAVADQVTPVAAALRLADELADEPHPIWGHRGRAIVDSLLAAGWENG